MLGQIRLLFVFSFTNRNKYNMQRDCVSPSRAELEACENKVTSLTVTFLTWERHADVETHA